MHLSSPIFISLLICISDSFLAYYTFAPCTAINLITLLTHPSHHMTFHCKQIRSPDLARQYILLPLAISTNIRIHSGINRTAFHLFYQTLQNTNALILSIYYHYIFCLLSDIFLAYSLILFIYLLGCPLPKKAFPDPSLLLSIYSPFFIFSLRNNIYLKLTSHYILIYFLSPLLETASQGHKLHLVCFLMWYLLEQEKYLAHNQHSKKVINK